MPEQRTAQGQGANAGLQALVSIHDVMPQTRPQVTDMLGQLALPPQAVTLLVVPGKAWSEEDLAWLRELQNAGHPLAGHGWSHRCQPPVTLYHKLHSALLSRQVAEHLSLSGEAIVGLVQDCHEWFAHHDLTASSLYVPPAWALGSLSRSQVARLPFACVETLSGVLDTGTGTHTRLPLVGFEADTRFRALFLGWFNALNVSRARRQRVPLRIGLHPFDLSFHLAPQIFNLLKQVETLACYDGYFERRMASCSSRPEVSGQSGFH